MQIKSEGWSQIKVMNINLWSQRLPKDTLWIFHSISTVSSLPFLFIWKVVRPLTSVHTWQIHLQRDRKSGCLKEFESPWPPLYFVLPSHPLQHLFDQLLQAQLFVLLTAWLMLYFMTPSPTYSHEPAQSKSLDYCTVHDQVVSIKGKHSAITQNPEACCCIVFAFSYYVMSTSGSNSFTGKVKNLSS